MGFCFVHILKNVSSNTQASHPTAPVRAANKSPRVWRGHQLPERLLKTPGLKADGGEIQVPETPGGQGMKEGGSPQSSPPT